MSSEVREVLVLRTAVSCLNGMNDPEVFGGIFWLACDAKLQILILNWLVMCIGECFYLSLSRSAQFALPFLNGNISAISIIIVLLLPFFLKIFLVVPLRTETKSGLRRLVYCIRLMH